MSYYFATIDQDEDLSNPRDEWEHLGTLYTWHSRYKLGGNDDENHQEVIQDFEIWAFDYFNDLAKIPELSGMYSDYGSMYRTEDDEELNYEELQFFKKIVNNWINDNVAILPVYMYDHSGITISTGPFGCPWDSGQVGLIYLEKKTCERHGIDFKDAERIIKSEIEELDQYLTGDVWNYTIYETDDEDFDTLILSYEDDLPNDKEILDSYCGFYGRDHVETEVKAILHTYALETC